MSENNFNVCSRCGSANPLSARYCYQCGFELKNPEAPVVCTKCNTVNNGTSNFCKRCGSKLPKAQSKVLCPQCSASNNAGATFCANCGYDFTTHSMPSSVAVSQQIQRQEQIAASSSVAVTKSQDKKLSRKEKKQLKREEEEKRYREEMAARKQAKIEQKEAKKAAKATKNQPATQQQPQAVQYPVVMQQPVQYMPPVMQQVVQTPQKPKTHRLKNFIVLLIALVGLYLILLPEYINFLGEAGAMMTFVGADFEVALTGWDVLIAVIAKFVPSIFGLSTVASTYAPESIELLISSVILAIVVIVLVLYVLAKLIGVLTGRAHKGVDVWAIILMLLTGGVFAFAFFNGVNSLKVGIYAITVPAVFLAIAIFNSKIRKD